MNRKTKQIEILAIPDKMRTTILVILFLLNVTITNAQITFTNYSSYYFPEDICSSHCDIIHVAGAEEGADMYDGHWLSPPCHADLEVYSMAPGFKAMTDARPLNSTIPVDLELRVDGFVDYSDNWVILERSGMDGIVEAQQIWTTEGEIYEIPPTGQHFRIQLPDIVNQSNVVYAIWRITRINADNGYYVDPNYYVDVNATGQNDGSSWIDAFNSLQDAITAASEGEGIWVAKGIYKPDDGNGITPGDRYATFQLKNGVAIYGGFPTAACRFNQTQV